MKFPVVLLCGPKGEIVYVLVPVPPVATEAIVPFALPLHKGATNEAEVNVKAAGCVMATVVVRVQPLASVPVMV